MATFLDLCRRVHRYARIDKHAPGTAPDSVIGQTGVLAEIVGWVNDANLDIQLDQEDWRFRMAEGLVSVAAGTGSVTITDTLRDYDALRPYVAESCVPYLLAKDGGGTQHVVILVDWNDWRGGIHDRGVDAQGLPGWGTVAADGTLRLDPAPSQDVTLRFEYRRKAKPLIGDDDVSLIPDRNSAAIVWRALMYYADTRDGVSDAYKKWERRCKNEMQRLYAEQLPMVTL